MTALQPLFTALADPVRRQLLVDLAEHSPRTATQLARHYPQSRQGILKHLNVLREADLVTVYQRGREKRYSLSPASLRELDQWIAALNGKWDARLNRLKALVEEQNP